jgi:hypothetical protein
MMRDDAEPIAPVDGDNQPPEPALVYESALYSDRPTFKGQTSASGYKQQRAAVGVSGSGGARREAAANQSSHA